MGAVKAVGALCVCVRALALLGAGRCQGVTVEWADKGPDAERKASGEGRIGC